MLSVTMPPTRPDIMSYSMTQESTAYVQHSVHLACYDLFCSACFLQLPLQCERDRPWWIALKAKNFCTRQVAAIG